MSEIELEPKTRILWPDFTQAKITVEIALTLDQWRNYIKATEKTGGVIANKICACVSPAISQIEKAMDAVKECKKL